MTGRDDEDRSDVPRRKERPARSEAGRAETAERQRRSAAALRENLRRRKAQRAARTEPAEGQARPQRRRP
jgi:hypothetical protein